MAITSNTLRPGLLVSLKTTVHGNVSYQRRVIEADHVVNGGAKRASWETERTISDPEEHEAAATARSKASSLVRAICARSAFGLLCPESSEPELEKAIAAAREVAEEFNNKARLSRVTVYVITGRIAPDDVEAVRAINSEVRDLLAEMSEGIRNLDVKAVRDAAGRAKNLGSMLSPDAEARIQIAIEAARSAARKIVKAGEQAAQEIDRVAIKRITEARTAFLDLEDAREVATPQETSRALDLMPAASVSAPRPVSRSIEVE
jgi:hypothetical protein